MSSKWSITIKNTYYGIVYLTGEKGSNCSFKKSPRNGLTNKIVEFVKKNRDKLVKCYKYSFTVEIQNEKVRFEKLGGMR